MHRASPERLLGGDRPTTTWSIPEFCTLKPVTMQKGRRTWRTVDAKEAKTRRGYGLGLGSSAYVRWSFSQVCSIFPPTFMAETLLMLDALPVVTLVLSTFQFKGGLYKTLRLIVWIMPTIRVALLLEEALSIFPYFGIHLIGSSLPAPTVLASSFRRLPQNNSSYSVLSS